MTLATIMAVPLAAGIGTPSGSQIGLVVFLLLAAASLAYVIAPLLRKDAAEAERVAASVSAEMDLHSRHDMVLAALKDLEEDRATDKIDDADYESLKGKLETRAVEFMRQIDLLDEERRAKETQREAERVAQRTPRAVPHPSSRS